MAHSVERLTLDFSLSLDFRVMGWSPMQSSPLSVSLLENLMC